MKMRLGLGALALSATLALPFGASAVLYSSETEFFGPASPNYNPVLTFNQYPGALGDLIGVKVIVDLAIDGGELSIDNDGANPAVASVELGATASVSSGDVNIFPLVPQAAASTMANLSVAGDDGDGPNYQPGGPDWDTMLGGPDSDSQSSNINAVFWSDYVGAGTFDINAAVQQVLDFGGLGGVSGSFSPLLAGGSVTVEYHVVPEPASLSLLGLGALALVRRRH